MAIAMALGGFSAAQADELRRAMGHVRKIPKLKAALEKLRNACIARGVSDEVANEVVRDLHSFANYGFPESHAWSFALIAYATAWLKAHYPAEFFLGLLNAWPMGFYPPATLVHVARRDGVTVLGPCLRDGEWDCTVELQGLESGVWSLGSGLAAGADAPDVMRKCPIENNQTPDTRHQTPGTPFLRIGWRHIRGLGDRTREALQSARKDGPFTSIADVVRRAELSRADALHLARAGALEAFQPGRRKAAWEALRAAGDLLPLAPARTLPFDPEELEDEELIFLDYLATGICVDGHPMECVRPRLDAAGIASSRDLAEHANGERIVVAGLVVARQHPETANGTVFVLLEDEWGFINVIVPAKLFAQNREVVKSAPFLVVEGRFEREDAAMNVVGWRFRGLPMRKPRSERIAYRSKDFR